MAGLLDIMALTDAVQRRESSSDPLFDAPSKSTADLVNPRSGARGIMQVKPDTAMDPGYGVPSIFQFARDMGFDVQDEDTATAKRLLDMPDVNRAFGARYLSAMLDRFGDVETALVAYNQGPGYANRMEGTGIKDDLKDEARDYITQIGHYYQEKTGERFPMTFSPRPKLRPKGLLD